MHISLIEKDKINTFDINSGVLNIKYGINGRVQGRISAYELTDNKPCVLNLVGSNFSVAIYFKNLLSFFRNEKVLTDYLEQNVSFENLLSTAKEVVVEIGKNTFDDLDMEALRKQLEKDSGVPLV